MRTAIVETPDDAAKQHRTGRVSTISRRFPRPRKSRHPWYTEGPRPGNGSDIRYTNEVCP
jgi:hypothetical protein